MSTTRRDDPETQRWIAEARAMPLLATAERFGFAAKRRAVGARESVGPCPLCRGDDRFAVNEDKGVWNCRGRGGGTDAIGLVMHVTDMPFLDAVETLVGKRPDGAFKTSPRAAEAQGRADHRIGNALCPYDEPDLVAAWRSGVDAADRLERDKQAWREKERRRAHVIWRSGSPLPGTLGETYLRHRGLGPLLDAGHWPRLRFIADLDYYEPCGANRVIRIGSGPALVAALVSPANLFAGVHITWLKRDGRGKAEFHHPQTGEVLLPKKVRGAAKGARIMLLGPRGAVFNELEPDVVHLGEGNETSLSVAVMRLGEPGFSGFAFWSSYSLGNLGGPCLGMDDHPMRKVTITMKRGRRAGQSYTKPERVMSAVPDLDPLKPVIPMAGIKKLILLGDGDSEPFATCNALLRAKARAGAVGVEAIIKTAAAGGDFNDILKKKALPEQAAWEMCDA